jgi:hypothetical protein
MLSIAGGSTSLGADAVNQIGQSSSPLIYELRREAYVFSSFPSYASLSVEQRPQKPNPIKLFRNSEQKKKIGRIHCIA